MSLFADINDYVAKTFSSNWETRKGQVVPTPVDLKLGNDAVIFDRATVLYADLTSSTYIVDTIGWQRSAEIYKAFLHCSSRLIREEGGTITSYDGDRVMGLFIGDNQSTSAVKCALKINWTVQSVINTALNKQYSDNSITVSQVVGIDTSEIRAARTGIRGDNDIVWVGRSANYAAKLTEIKQSERTWITKAVYDQIHESAKFGGNPKVNMWKQYNWSEHNNSTIYGSTFWWKID